MIDVLLPLANVLSLLGVMFVGMGIARPKRYAVRGFVGAVILVVAIVLYLIVWASRG